MLTLPRCRVPQSEDLVLEVNGLRQLVKLKNKELRTIKKLAQTILNQRTEVEQFFLDALSSVKGEIAKSKAEARAKGKLWGRGRTAGVRCVRRRCCRRGGGGCVACARERWSHHRPPRVVQANTKFPPLGASPRGSTGGGDKVELADLTLEDRERVLRLLFAKINNVQTYAGSFAHSMTSGMAPESSYQTDDGMEHHTEVDIRVAMPAGPVPPEFRGASSGAGGGAGAGGQVRGLATGAQPQLV